MTNLFIYSIGFTAQVLFSLRFLIQWLKSEKQKQIIVPSSFWVFSLIGALLLFIYGYLRNDFAIMLGQVLTYFIYIRNLQFQNKWKKAPYTLRYILVFLPFVISVFYVNNNDISTFFRSESISTKLLVLGIASQIILSLRFVYQWMYSEKNKISFLPLGFWVISCFGSLLIFVYAIYRKDPVLLIAHFFGTILYFRNIIILKNQKQNIK